MYLSGSEGFDLWSAAKRQHCVLFALMLRDIRTRFGGHGLGYLIALAWPLTHILVLLAVFVGTGRAAPYGDSVVLFLGIGTVTFQSFSYLARFMMQSIIRTRPLLGFPEVKILDVLLASALLESLAACCVVVILIMLAWVAGINFMPKDIVQAACAFGAALLLGLGFGLLNGVIALALPLWGVTFALTAIILWITSGVLFVPDTLPETFRNVVSYNPVLHVIEWMKSAYYDGYGGLVLDRGYPISVGLGAIFLGLLLERGMRG
jgi:capsular polysaccharide transport system permease protein